MKTLKRFGAALVLLSLFCLTAVAGEVPTPPCTPGEIPTMPCATGETHTPPSEAQTTSDSTGPGETHGPPPFAVVITVAGVAFELVMFW